MNLKSTRYGQMRRNNVLQGINAPGSGPGDNNENVSAAFGTFAEWNPPSYDQIEMKKYIGICQHLDD